MPSVRIIDGPGAGLAVELQDALSIGRDPSCGLQLADVKASRRHALISPQAEGWQLRDSGSANGIWQGKERISQLDLSDGSEFRIGGTVLRFEDSHQIPPGSADDQAWGETITGLESSGPGESALFTTESSLSAGANDYLLLLHQVVHRSQGTASREELFDILDNVAADALDGDRCAVFLPKDSGWLLWPPHERRLRARFGATPFAGTLLSTARQRLQPLLCTARGDLDPSMSMAQAGLRSAMVAPLRIGSEVHALLYVDRLESSTPFSRRDLEFLEAVANQLAVRLHNMSELSRLSAEVERLSVSRPREQVTLIANASNRETWQRFIESAAQVQQPVLIVGEPGTGKRSLAKAIHQASERASAPLQMLACASLDESACELSLFGRAAGSADEARPGLLELAHQGSLLLDDIGSLSPLLQRRVLQVLEEGQCQRLGETAPRQVEVRLFATLQPGAEDGLIPELAQALSTMRLDLPPLRERGEDLDLLIEHAIAESAERLDQPVRSLSPEARSLLLGYAWPGNIRQLRSVIERAMVIAHGPLLQAEDLPEHLREDAGHSPAPNGNTQLPLLPLAEMERSHILRMLEHCGGNKKAAAELLGIDRSTLYAKLRQYGVHG